MNQPHEDLARLASYVVGARIEAGFATRKDFAAATGITARTLGKLETAAERVSADTLARVAAALGWTPDSPALVMAGRDPVLLAGAKPGPATEQRPPLRPVRAPLPVTAASASADTLASLLADYPDDPVVVSLGTQPGKAPRAMVAEILEWLDFLESKAGTPQNGTSAG